MKGFFRTVAVVTVFSVCEKFLGFIYRIFLSRTIGSEGMGMYQIALSVFALLFTVVCAGVPITVSRLMTKHKAENMPEKANMVISSGLFFTLIVAIPVFTFFYFFADKLSFLFTDVRCVNIFKLILPSLIFTSLYAVLRGVFWGRKDFLSYSVIELLEEICMILVGVIIIPYASNVYSGAYRATFAVLISYLFSFTLALIMFFIRKNKLSNPLPELKPIVLSSTPITAMRAANSLAVSLVSIILPLRLVASGMTNSEALSAFGAAAGQAIPILSVPSTLIGSFTLVLVPEIAEDFYKKNHLNLKRNIEKSMKFSVLISCIFIPVFFVCGEEIGVLVFNSVESGKYLSVSAFLMLFMSTSSLSTSILNSIGYEKRTLLYYIISGAFMFACIWFLPTLIGIYSLLVGFTFVFALTTVLNLILLHKKCVQKPRYLKFIIYSALFTVPTCFLGVLLEKILLPLLGTVFTFLLVSGLLFIFITLLFIGFNMFDINIIKSKLKFKHKPKKA